MAITYVQGNNHGNGSSASTTVAVTLAAPVGVGNLLCVTVAWAGLSGHTVSCTDDKSNVYTLSDKLFNSTTTFLLGTLYFQNTTNGPQTITATISASVQFATILVDEFSGIATTSAADGHAIANPTKSATANAQSSGNITTTANGDLIYASCVDVDGHGTITAGTSPSYTQRQTVVSAYMIESLVQGTSGTVAGTFTASSALDNFIVAVMAFKAAAAAAAQTVEWAQPFAVPLRPRQLFDLNSGWVPQALPVVTPTPPPTFTGSPIPQVRNTVLIY